MNTTNKALLPESAMPTIIAPDSSMLDMMICLRPILSDRWPPIGAAMKPAIDSVPTQRPVAKFE